MDDFEPLADLTNRFCAAVREAPSDNLQQRVTRLAALAPALLVAARGLPSVPELPPPPPGPAAAAWPGLGRFDADGLSERVLAADAWLCSALGYWERGDVAGAVTVWAGGYPVWSVAVAEVVPGLHAAALRFRPEPAPLRAARVAPVVTLGPDAEPARAIGAAAPPKAQRPALGLRFEAIGLGAWVREVHPKGPAAGLLEPGDVLLAVDGLSLEHVDANVLAQRMVGKVGATRTYDVYRDGVTRQVRFAAVDAGALLQS